MKTEIVTRIRKNSKVSNEIEKKANLYSIFILILLSKELFPKNIDIKNFVNNFNFGKDIGDYLYDCRTPLVARVIRIIDRSEISQLMEFDRILIDYFEIKDVTKELRIYNHSEVNINSEVSEIVKTFNRFSRKKKK